MVNSRLPSSRSSLTFLIVAVLSLLHVTSAAVSDFSYYPQGAQSCLQSASTSSKCDQSTVAKFNACVCSNGGNFIDDAAKCIGKNSSSDLTTTYTVLSRNCADSNTPVSYTLDKFLAQGSATTAQGSATTRTATSLVTITRSGTTKVSTSLSVVTTRVAPAPVVSTITVATTNAAGQTTGVLSVVTFAPLQSVTAPPSSSSSPASSGGSSGLSTGAAVGIGVGVGVPIVLALCGLIGVLIWRGKKKDRSAAAAAAGSSGAVPEKAYAHEVDSSSAAHSQSQSPYTPHYAQPVTAAAAAAPYKSSPPVPHATYDQNLPADSQGYGQGQSLPPVELSGTPLYPEPQELPGSYRQPHQ